MTYRLDNRRARHLLFHLQGLSDPPRRKQTDDDLHQLIERLGYVQVDSINTVERAHHMILFARNQTYRQKQLSRLVERERRLFENWVHDAAVIPCAFYPYWRHHFTREEMRLAKQWESWRGNNYRDHLDQVLELVRGGGPNRARDLGTDQPKGSGGWWDWHPGKTALEFHWRTGRLAVCHREGFQKVYDLAERVIPACHRDEVPERAAFLNWACGEALARLGIATPGQVADFWGLISAQEAKDWLTAQPVDRVIQVEVEGCPGSRPRKLFARADLPELAADLPTPPERLRALSPFDPVIRDRGRLAHLFGFDYRIEVFVPAAKRRYGYYVFPLLEADRFVGRIDMVHERDRGELRVKGLWLEPKCRLTKGRQAALESELARQARFTGAENIVYDEGYVKEVG
ncbi:MAG: crosslink repair DNA glycosylase YcaQ family protein [Pseudomonadota bacterium]